MKIKKFLKKFKSALKQLRLTDRFLLIFMFILMCEQAHSIFNCEVLSDSANSIDVAIRTTIAGIFGYFIGAGFLYDDKSENITKQSIRTPIQSESQNPISSARIGFTADSDSEPSLEYGKVELRSKQVSPNAKRIRQQIFIVGIIGLISLVLLVLAGNSNISSNAYTALSQLRDFVSGSVGFFIGHSNSKK